jgi:intein/homing endonuclease
VNKEVAEILGAFLGDGWIESRKSALYILGDPFEDLLYYNNYLGPLFIKNFSDGRLKPFSSWGVYGLVSYKKQTISKAIDLGFQIGPKALCAKIPEKVFFSKDKSIIKSVLRGLFDTDGCFWCEKSNTKTSTEWKRTHHYHPELKITSCSKQLLNQCNELLDRLGIESRVVQKCKKGFKYGRNRNNLYLLRIRKIKEIKKWFDVIGSSNPRHQTRYAIWENLGYLPPRTTLKNRLKILECV